MILFGDVGGFAGAIILLPTFFMPFYSEKMFKSSLSQEIQISTKSKKSYKNKPKSVKD